ncbi:FtsQ-type POTRA domain-containing protein [Candidatus Pelagibacter bacterium]|nr:FtsQ-type POTRA domain-containing protein [Candidatus Pelagibacter bacterium]
MKKKIVIALILLIMLSTYKPEKLFLSSKFKIEQIKIENNSILKERDIKKNLAHLYEKNIFIIDTQNILNILKKNTFIESFEIKKIYPNKIIIKIYEKKPIAILEYKKQKFYINQKIDLIDFVDLEEYRELPIVFGNKDYFKLLYTNLKKIDFPLDIIKKYHLHESKRWDLEIENKIIIRLPVENYIKSLKNFMYLMNEKNFEEFKLFDYRINNQLILK